MLIWLPVLWSALQPDPSDPRKEKKSIEAVARPCFSNDQVAGVEYNAFWLDLKNVSEEDLELACVFETLGLAKVTQRVFLPKGASQRIYAYLPPSDSGVQSDINVAVFNKYGKDLYKEVNQDSRVPAATVGDPAKSFRVLILNDEMNLNQFDLPTNTRGKPLALASCEAKNFPDSWIGLRGFQACVLYKYSLSALRPEQQQALYDWVVAGGRLFVIPSNDPAALKAAPLDELMVFDWSGPEMISECETLSKLFGVPAKNPPFAFYPVRGPKRHQYDDPKGPLLVWEHRGRGRVYLLAFDLVGPPLTSQDRQRTAFWTALLNDAWQAGELDKGPVAKLHAANTMIVPPPPIGIVILIVVAFVVLVGPVNYVVLFQRKRPIFSVITIPAISILFAIVVLALGLILRSGHRLGTNLVVVQAHSGNPAGYEIRLVSVLSPGSKAYDFEFLGRTYLYTANWAEEEEERFTGGRTQQMTIEKLPDGMALRGIRLQRFEARQYYAHGVRRLGKGITLRREKDLLIARNDSPFTLSRGLYAVPGNPPSFYEVDRLPPGLERRFALTAQNLVSKPVVYLAGSDPGKVEAAQALLKDPEAEALFILSDSDPGKIKVSGLPGAGPQDLILFKILPEE
jgi:hypothetical protein